jgi:hypothetical protein
MYPTELYDLAGSCAPLVTPLLGEAARSTCR